MRLGAGIVNRLRQLHGRPFQLTAVAVGAAHLCSQAVYYLVGPTDWLARIVGGVAMSGTAIMALLLLYTRIEEDSAVQVPAVSPARKWTTGYRPGD
jgi:hypothetical protein